MTLRVRRLIGFLIIVFGVGAAIYTQQILPDQQAANSQSQSFTAPTPSQGNQPLALSALQQLRVKGRAPKTGYTREQFGNGWATTNGCDTREIILHRDMPDAIVDSNCNVLRGTLNDPYTGKVIHFTRGATTSAAVQIDHVVALGNAWQTGAQQLTAQQRVQLANDPLELLAVDGSANEQKGDGDAATWLPPNKPFRCQYVARQVAVKQKYSLWVTQAEKAAIERVLNTCLGQQLPAP